MEELAAFAAAGGDQTANAASGADTSSSCGYSSDGSADSNWEPDSEDASSTEKEDERRGSIRDKDMDTSIVLIDDDLKSKVTRLIREEACKKSIIRALDVLKGTDTVLRHRGTCLREQYHYYFPFVGHVPKNSNY
ncbi:hypothetical protein PF011_g28306 [Phytophthora fragariae]|uniref:Uncharacterized protein n=3 Tax=Phytophthora fragariae TaxID=53985 RepID=A0A6A3H7C5_9STRA|nr:hypothetical protein PF011_g28306 [Phytophthora fragariae]